MTSADPHYMQTALLLAERQLGAVAPNPAVAAIIVKDDVILARGVTQQGGRPHAETIALQAAGAKAKAATMYVTFEPCAHTGATPPCAQSIIDAGIARVVVACEDPDSRVSGKGIAMLKQAGIEVVTGMSEKHARALNRGFIRRVTKNRPLVSIKIASSLDARVATASGQSEWLTGEEARAYGHVLRAQHDAILTGIDSVLTDNPQLTCRLPGMEERSPARIVLDSNFRFPVECKLAQSARQTPTYIFTLKHSLDNAAEKKSALEKLGVQVLSVEGDGGHIKLDAMLEELAKIGITRLMIEAGRRVTSAFLEAKLADTLYWFRAPLAVGGNGLEAIGNISPITLKDIPRWKILETRRFGPDMMEVIDLCSPD